MIRVYGSELAQQSMQAERFIMQLDKPVDWKQPHRYCLARYARLVLEQDSFSEKLGNGILSDRDIFSYITCRQLKETALIKRVNQLSFEDKVQLLTIKDYMIKNNLLAIIR